MNRIFLRNSQSLSHGINRETLGFLLFGLLFVALLSFVKYRENRSVPRDEAPALAIELPTSLIHVADSRVHLSTLPISRTLFAEFVQQTRYRTWREEQGLMPTWKTPTGSEEDAPVGWLVFRDARRFCSWLGTMRGTTYRLPRAAELSAYLESEPSARYHMGHHWLWTSQTLADFDSTVPNGQAYHTAWRADGTLYHRRTRDLVDPDAPSITFFVVEEKSGQ